MNIAVIAGNYREYRDYVLALAEKSPGGADLQHYPSKIGNKWYFYISGTASLRGRKYESFVFFGTCRNRDDFNQIQEEIKYIEQRDTHEIRR